MRHIILIVSDQDGTGIRISRKEFALNRRPNSRQVVARDLGNLPTSVRAKLVRENVARLYNIPVPSPIQ
jgi:hypothetical protein